MFEGLKETMFNELKENMTAMNRQIENIRKKIENIKRIKLEF